ncbi:MAG: hypothetical protein ACLGIF_00660 [Actinomycetes bacterium]
MSEMAAGAGTGGQLGRADEAQGGPPTESDLPRLQGLDDSVDDPSDPQAAQGDEAAGNVPLANLMDTGDATSSSDPMPDMTGTTGP